jgi:hypothetical protein
MKLTLAAIVFVIIGLVLGWGIFLIMKGNYWVLIAGLVAYQLAFARFGCSHH